MKRLVKRTASATAPQRKWKCAALDEETPRGFPLEAVVAVNDKILSRR